MQEVSFQKFIHMIFDSVSYLYLAVNQVKNKTLPRLQKKSYLLKTQRSEEGVTKTQSFQAIFKYVYIRWN